MITQQPIKSAGNIKGLKGFQKGVNGYWLGKKQSPEMIKKRFYARKSFKISEETKKKIGLVNRGIWIKFECKTCGKVKEEKQSHYIKRDNHFCSRKCVGIYFRISKKGSKSHFWKGGITEIHQAIRTSIEYEEWRKKVFEKDNYTCQDCGTIGGYLQADHIKMFAFYPELRFEVSNGQTLCRACHKNKTTKEMKLCWVNQFSKVQL